MNHKRKKRQSIRRRKEPRNSPKMCINEYDPVTDLPVTEIRDLISVRMPDGDVCFSRAALIDYMMNGPVWFANEYTAKGISGFLEAIITMGGHGGGSNSKIENRVIHEIYNKGYANATNRFINYLEGGNDETDFRVFYNFLGKFLTIYRLLEWPLDEGILLSGSSIKYLMNPNIKEFHLVKSTYRAEEPHTLFGPGDPADVYLLTDISVTEPLEYTMIDPDNRNHTIVVADYDDVDNLPEEANKLPYANYGGIIFYIGEILENNGLVLPE